LKGINYMRGGGRGVCKRRGIESRRQKSESAKNEGKGKTDTSSNGKDPPNNRTIRGNKDHLLLDIGGMAVRMEGKKRKDHEKGKTRQSQYHDKKYSRRLGLGLGKTGYQNPDEQEVGPHIQNYPWETPKRLSKGGGGRQGENSVRKKGTLSKERT